MKAAEPGDVGYSINSVSLPPCAWKDRRPESLTVLTVDDSLTMRDILTATLKCVGFSVIQAEDGVHGLEVLEAQDRTPDLIITDINMPRMDGFGFIEAVRREVGYEHIPILVLSTESNSVKIARGFASGASGWVYKPFKLAQLVNVINLLLNTDHFALNI